MTGDVGIFWIYRGQLIKAAVPLVDGNDDGLFVNGPDDHDSESVKNPRDQQNIPLEKSSRERLNHCYISLQLNTLRPGMVSVTTMSSLGRRLRHEVEAMRRQKCVLQQREPCALESLLLKQVHSDMARGQEGGCLHECHETVTPTRGVGWPRICHRV